jgi:hypothetical protein
VTTSIARYSAFIAAAALFAAGCGSNSSDSTTTGDSPASTSSTSSGGVKMVAAAPIPPDLKCSDAIVWVNLASKAYHLSGDKFYGRSKRGEYECRATADGKGYHLAGTGHGHSNGGEPSPSST